MGHRQNRTVMRLGTKKSLKTREQKHKNVSRTEYEITTGAKNTLASRGGAGFDPQVIGVDVG